MRLHVKWLTPLLTEHAYFMQHIFARTEASSFVLSSRRKDGAGATSVRISVLAELNAPGRNVTAEAVDRVYFLSIRRVFLVSVLAIAFEV